MSPNGYEASRHRREWISRPVCRGRGAAPRSCGDGDAALGGTAEGRVGGTSEICTIVQADLRSRRGLTEAVTGHDAVLHLAAAKSGDLYAQYAGTVVATENLLAAMTEAGVRRIVLVSSLSVYDYLKLRASPS